MLATVHTIIRLNTMAKKPSIRKQQRASSKRLLFVLNRIVKAFIGRIEVVGEHNLALVPPAKKIILATTHISDLDVAIVAVALGSNLDIALTDISVHRSIVSSLKAGDPTVLILALAGKHNFLPLTYKQEKGTRRGQIHPKDFHTLKAILTDGKAVVIAAHNPVPDGTLPAKPGYAAIRTAQITEDAVVLPVAVCIGETSELFGMGNVKNIIRTLKRKPKATVSIGESIVLANPDAKKAAQLLEEVITGVADGQELSEKAKQTIREAREVINKTEGATLMKALAKLLPPEKRGNW
jgi:hypothetical protein